MENKTPKFRNALLFILLLILIFPVIQSALNLVKIKPLNGDVTIASSDSFSVKGWFSGEFQEKQEKYINDNFGLRNFFVRLNNQIAFNLFKKAKANGVIVGKNNYLYEEDYIKAYYGLDYIGIDSIQKQLLKLKFIQDTLTKLNKTFVLIIASGKGSFYPEFFPEKYKKYKKGISNYDSYIKISKQYGINLIDFNKYFIKNKTKSKYPLMPKYGIHWSYYGSVLVTDSIIKYIKSKRNINMPKLSWNELNIDYPKNDDYDIARGMNLLFELKDEKLAYPETVYFSDSNEVKPSVLAVADSYYWLMYTVGIHNALSTNHFWFYNRNIYPESNTSPLTTDMVDVKAEMLKHDVIIIMATERNLNRLGWGFIEETFDAYKGYSNNNQKKRKAKLEEYVIAINNNPEWLRLVKKKALDQNIPLEEMIIQDAQYAIEHEQKE